MKITLTLVFILLTVPYVNTWHALGHITVARIAQIFLQKSDFGNKAYVWATSIIRPFSSFCGEKNYPFAECATWPDKIKKQDWWSMSEWHFSNVAYYAPGYTPKDQNVTVSAQNISWAILKCESHLMSRKEDTAGQSNSLLGKSIAFRNLIHFLGDIHQPLHTTTRISAAHPTHEGDLGGNLFKIKRYEDPSWNELHFVWDHLFDQFKEIGMDEVDSPMSPSQNDFVNKFANEIMSNHTYESVKEQMYKNWTTESWIQEGNQITNDFVYKGLVEGDELPEWYVEEGKKVVNKRLALGGYRLAKMVEHIYSKFINAETQKPNMVN